jgi:hypothetical protein
MRRAIYAKHNTNDLTNEVSVWENVVKTVFYIKYELEVWLSSE